MDDYQTYTKPNRFYTILRWIVLLPSALLAGWLGWLVVSFVNRISFGMMGINPDSFFSRIFIEGVSHGVLGAGVVYVSAKVAPTHKVIVVFVMAGLSLLGAGILLFPAIASKNLWAIFSCICIAIGAGGVAWAVYSGEISEEDL